MVHGLRPRDENEKPEHANANVHLAGFGFKHNRRAAAEKEKAELTIGTSDAMSPGSARTPLVHTPNSNSVSVTTVDFSSVVHNLMRDADAVEALLRKKPTAGKYDYKDKTAQLEEILGLLRTAVKEQNRREKDARDNLVLVQQEVNGQLQALTFQKDAIVEQLEAAKRREKELSDTFRHEREEAVEMALQERTKAMDTLRRERDEAVDSVRREAEAKSKRWADDKKASESAMRAIRDRGLKELAEKETFIVEKERLIKQREQELEEARKLIKTHQDAADQAAKRETELKSNMNEAGQLVLKQAEDSERLLKKQIADAEQRLLKQVEEAERRQEQIRSDEKRKRKQLQLDAKQREEDLLAAQEELRRDLTAENERIAREATSEREQLLNTSKTCQLQLQEERDQALTRVHELDGKLEASGEAHEVLKREHAALHETLAHARSEVDRMAAERRDLENQLSATNGTRDKVTEAHCALQAQFAAKSKAVEQHQTELETAASRLSELEAQLAAAMSARDESLQSYSALQSEHASLQEAAAERRGTMQALQAQLSDKDAALTQKDADLRESLKSVQQMHRDHSDQLQFERQRVQKLEGELQTVRDDRQKELADTTAAREELASARALLAEKSELAERREKDKQHLEANLQLQLKAMEGERDRLLEKAADDQAQLKDAQRELMQAKEQLASVREELSSSQVSLSEKSELLERTAHEKHMGEVEFRSYKEHHGTSDQQQVNAITELKITVEKLSKQVESTQLELRMKCSTAAEQKSYIAMLEQQAKASEQTRRDLHNAIQELKGNIRVFCRVRPQLAAGDDPAVLPSDDVRLSVGHGGENHSFSFDKVFGPASRQEQVFEEVSGLVQSALDGYKVCIFAYGQTGSGKTFTMQGTDDPVSWGLIPRALSKIFESAQSMRAAGWNWSLQASFLEVYNENVRDLLRTSSSNTTANHVIKHDDAWGTMVTNMTCVEVDSMEQIHKLMARAAKMRAVGATDMNEISSRSHSVFALYLRGLNKESKCELHGALHLVDLAGSERLIKSGATGDRLKETQNINKSLSSLVDVFVAKQEGHSHVPFRNSKLTHLMEPCLSGQGKTLMVVNVGPEQSNSHETLCSLRFAGQVSQCNTGGKPKRSAKSAASGTASAQTRPPATAPRSATPQLTKSASSTSPRVGCVGSRSGPRR
eukprot:gnl/TRDRNA2_/TRDRNA2_184268_c0_seq1.p1 gnl/TRDRNA2_/TRDRNA2_184268_c0~~gnl/TRDRNA2_/TRDRNA2_184268_c0_seq1.p1  ORF type:complete len:1175 (+),score=317.96 gnl/TRDRNA2_/TRDRNA2_184268_c0_seq1:73-3597(+)